MSNNVEELGAIEASGQPGAPDNHMRHFRAFQRGLVGETSTSSLVYLTNDRKIKDEFDADDVEGVAKLCMEALLDPRLPHYYRMEYEYFVSACEVDCELHLNNSMVAAGHVQRILDQLDTPNPRAQADLDEWRRMLAQCIDELIPNPAYGAQAALGNDEEYGDEMAIFF